MVKALLLLMLLQVQIESAHAIEGFKSSLPVIEELSSVLEDPHTLWYTSKTIIPAYQADYPAEGGYETRFIFVSYNQSADASERRKPKGRGGNANVDFPWRVTGGTHRCRGVTSFKFVWLPPQLHDTIPSQGRRWPIVWYRRQLSMRRYSRSVRGYAWTFPREAIVGEVLLLRGGSESSASRVFEVRTRTRTLRGWVPEIYRPFRTQQDLIAAVRQARPTLLRVIETMQLVPPREDRLHDMNLTKSGFDETTLVAVLPDFDDDLLIDELLDRPFLASFGEEWVPGCIAPTTDAPYHIVPRHYDAAFLGDCMSCHDAANGSTARSFDEDRGWYGFVRGSDGIVSWHPIDNEAIGRGTLQPVRIRKALVDGGIVAKYDKDKHPSTIYRRLEK